VLYERNCREIISADDTVIFSLSVFFVKLPEAFGKGTSVFENVGFVPSAFQESFFAARVREGIWVYGKQSRIFTSSAFEVGANGAHRAAKISGYRADSAVKKIFGLVAENYRVYFVFTRQFYRVLEEIAVSAHDYYLFHVGAYYGGYGIVCNIKIYSLFSRLAFKSRKYSVTPNGRAESAFNENCHIISIPPLLRHNSNQGVIFQLFSDTILAFFKIGI
jgi:hypothetical protein